MTLKVLLVEDNPMAVMGAKIVLNDYDTAISVAETGAKALELAKVQPFDLILMDIGLPDTDGFILTRDIHLKCALNKETKVVALTAHAGEDYYAKVSEHGLHGLIEKPLTLANFIEIFQSIGITPPEKFKS